MFYIALMLAAPVLSAETAVYQSPETPLGSGPYKAVMVSDPSLPTHTEYRPKDLPALGATKMPVIAWGNGACVNTGNRFRSFLTEIASYGYLVVALGPIGPKELESAPMTNPAVRKPGEAAPPPPAGLSRAPATKAAQLIDAIDWAIAENSRTGGQYAGKLDTAKIVIMGQSCGGVQAIQASADPRTTLTIAWNSGLLPEPSAGMEMISKDALKHLHAPIAYFTGDEANDVAFPNAADDFERIGNVPVLRAWKTGLPHIGTYRDPNGGELGKLAVAYLQWRLRGDKTAGQMFLGPHCGLCTDPAWHVSKKKID
jgi:dienelactone hydrolase